jgi:hypothetical protein
MIEIQLTYLVSFTSSEKLSKEDEYELSKQIFKNVAPSKKHEYLDGNKITFYRCYEPENMNIENDDINTINIHVHFLVPESWFLLDKNNVITSLKNLDRKPLSVNKDFICNSKHIHIEDIEIDNISMPARSGDEDDVDIIEF